MDRHSRDSGMVRPTPEKKLLRLPGEFPTTGNAPEFAYGQERILILELGAETAPGVGLVNRKGDG